MIHLEAYRNKKRGSVVQHKTGTMNLDTCAPFNRLGSQKVEDRLNSMFRKEEAKVQKKAHLGDAEAQLELGLLLIGEGINDDTAFRGYKWLVAAAAKLPRASRELASVDASHPWLLKRFCKEWTF